MVRWQHGRIVHNHGIDGGRGLNCPEHRDAEGRLVGACLSESPISSTEVAR